LLGLFFITVGTQVAPAILLDSPWATLGWLVVFLLLKAVLALPAARLGGLSRPDALRAAVILAHGGEFGLLLLSLALTQGLIPAAAGQPALFALAATMTFAPILIQHHDWIAIRLAGPLGRPRPLEEELRLNEHGIGMSRHIIVCGAGRLGRLVAMALDTAKLPCLVIESDYVRHREALELGLRSVSAMPLGPAAYAPRASRGPPGIKGKPYYYPVITNLSGCLSKLCWLIPALASLVTSSSRPPHLFEEK